MMDIDSHEQLDLKLKELVSLSKEVNDSKRAAIVFYLLIRRELNKKGIHLGFSPLISKTEQKAFEYMNKINLAMEKTFHFHLFNKEKVDRVKKYELLYLKGPTSISFDSLKVLITIYYDLRQLDIPNMYRSSVELQDNTNLLGFSAGKFLSLNNQKRQGSLFKKASPNHILHYLKLDLEQKEQLAEQKLKVEYDKKQFQQLLYLRKLKKQIREGDSSKISFKGKLKDNAFYQQEINQAPGHFLIGLAALFAMMAVMLFIENFMVPEIVGAFTLISFALFGGAFFIIILYWKLFYQEK
jgi:hypothetical protein